MRQLKRFFDSWAWGPAAAIFMFGYETDSFLESSVELARARRQPPTQPAIRSDMDQLATTLPVAPDSGLSRIVRRRRSRRTFDGRLVEPAQLAACLQAASGITGELEYERGPSVQVTGAPAPGGVNTFDAYVLVRRVSAFEAGTYCYVPHRHALAHRPGRPVPFDRLFGGQSWCANASCAIVLSADLHRQAARYAFPTTLGAVLIEAGARVELILLQAEELSLAAVVVGMTGVGAFDHELASAAGLPDSSSMVVPVCAVLLGTCPEGEREPSTTLPV